MGAAQVHGMGLDTGFTGNAADLSSRNNGSITGFSQLDSAAQMVKVTVGNENIFNIKIIDILRTAVEIRVKNHSMALMSQGKAGVIDKFKSGRHKISAPLKNSPFILYHKRCGFFVKKVNKTLQYQ